MALRSISRRYLELFATDVGATVGIIRSGPGPPILVSSSSWLAPEATTAEGFAAGAGAAPTASPAKALGLLLLLLLPLLELVYADTFCMNRS
jgi:hypothetical protein